MRILADESVDAPVIEQLRQDGHDVEEVAEHHKKRQDSGVLALAVGQHELLLTADRDFGDLIVRDASQAPAEGVVLYRLRHIPVEDKVRQIADVFALHAAELPGRFTVVDHRGIRSRQLS